MSKAIMEKVAVAKVRRNIANDTAISCVRYGNVMYSRGSVIPRFVKQIKSGKPITITNPEMIRFLMSLSAFVRLVGFAFSNAKQGDSFIKKSPSTTIKVLAEALVSLFSARNEIHPNGSRHGEKLNEALEPAEELSRSKDLDEFFRVSLDARDLNYDLYFDKGLVAQSMAKDYDSHTGDLLDLEQTKQLLLTLPQARAELGMKKI